MKAVFSQSLAALVTAFVVSSPVFAVEKLTKCQMTFDLESWSVFYKKGKGSGTISCENGQTSKVTIETHGGGFTFGKNKIVNGKASFSIVNDIQDLYGGYAMADAHAGIGGSAGANVMTKGNVSMALAGTGKGIDVGFSFGSFSVHPVGKK